MEEAIKKDDGGGGAPGWLATFADLMSLLMCFFVLLLSFSQMDIEKYKQVAGSMKLAFGVQREIKAEDVPKGTSIVAQEFSPGKPEPTVINEVRQKTVDETKQTLEFTNATERKEEITEQSAQEVKVAVTRETIEDMKLLQDTLEEELAQGLLEIEREGNTILLRIKERASFPSGSADLRPDFLAVLDKISEALTEINGNVVVAGHTDNVPIRSRRYRSNWDLSAARAVSVLLQFLERPELDPKRFVVEGHGDAHPLVPNDSPENRARNRRVEITIVQRPLELKEGEAELPVDELGGQEEAATNPGAG